MIYNAWPWHWNLTPAAVSRILQEQFDVDSVSLEVHGNVFVATAFLQGVSAEEIESSSLRVMDEKYPIVVAARAIKRPAA